jgi:hypothetical protein
MKSSSAICDCYSLVKYSSHSYPKRSLAPPYSTSERRVSKVHGFLLDPISILKSTGWLPIPSVCINPVIGTENSHFSLAYIDDLILFSSSFIQHLQHLETVLHKLKYARFTTNLKKYKFCQTRIKAPDRISVMLIYPAPRNQKHLRQFL